MDYKYIEQLLERYWQCETSLEEESELRSFFSEEEVPAHLLRYKELFVYQTVQQEAGLGKEIKGKLDDLFHGKTEDEIDDVITDSLFK